MRILRLTRHPANVAQLKELDRIFGGDAEVIEVSETVPSGERVKELVKVHQAQVLEAVLPLPILAEVVHPKTGVQIPVLRAAMVRDLKPDGSAAFTFSHYEKVVRMVIETEQL